MYAVEVRLMEGHGAGVTTEKSMPTDLFFCLFFFFDYIPEFFLLSFPFSSSFLLYSSDKLCWEADFQPLAIFINMIHKN